MSWENIALIVVLFYYFVNIKKNSYEKLYTSLFDYKICV